MSKRLGKIYVTKLASAQRLLCAAIRMFFSGEDELAIHAVASAAYSVVSDLKLKRGQDEAADIYGRGIFYLVRDYHKGKLPDYITNDSQLMEKILEWADRLPITATSNLKNISISTDKSAVRDFWNKQNKISNFLKHAEYDPNSHISLDEVNNLKLLTQGVAAYSDLTIYNLWPEGFVLFIYMLAAKGLKDGTHEEFRLIAGKLEELDPKDQLEFCSAWIKTSKEIIAKSSEKLDEEMLKLICLKSFDLSMKIEEADL